MSPAHHVARIARDSKARFYFELFRPSSRSDPKHGRGWSNFVQSLPPRPDWLPGNYAQLETWTQEDRAERGARLYHALQDRLTAAGMPHYSMRLGGLGMPPSPVSNVDRYLAATCAPPRPLSAVDRYLCGRRLAEVAAYLAAGRDPLEAITRSRLSDMRSRAVMYRNLFR
ncbi:MAG: hypothetical protein JXP48_13160 [Acidobacteria bacterium]|nr:hypothetical protein [Acidobacteriota bacterium]